MKRRQRLPWWLARRGSGRGLRLPPTFPFHMMCLSIQVIFSGWHIVARVTLNNGTNAFVFAAYRESLSCVLMYLLCRYKGASPRDIQSKDVFRIVTMGFFSFVNVVGAMLALKLVPPDRFSVLQPTIPVWTTLLAVVAGLEPIGLVKACAVLLAVLGAVVVELAPDDGEESGSDHQPKPNEMVLGTIITILQCMSTAVVLVLAKPITKRYPPTLITFCYYAAGSVFTVLSVLFVGATEGITAEDLVLGRRGRTWASLMYAVVLATFWCYNAFSIAVKHMQASVVTVYCTLQPLGTALLSVFVFGAEPGASEYIGGLLVIAGLVLSVWGAERDGHGDGAPAEGPAFRRLDSGGGLRAGVEEAEDADAEAAPEDGADTELAVLLDEQGRG